MTIKFDTNPAHCRGAKLAEAILTFEDPDTEGCVFHGYAVLKSKEGEIFIGLPNREYTTADKERRHFNLVRAEDPADKSGLDALKTKIIDAYNAEHG